MGYSQYEKAILPNLDRIEVWARDGLSNAQISRNLGIHPNTLTRAINAHEELREVMTKSKEIVDQEVVNAYLKRAMGYDVVEKTQEFKVIKGERVLVREYEKTRHIPADVNAAEHWIRFRMKEHEQWKGFTDAIRNNPQIIDMVDGESGVVLMPQRKALDEPKGENNDGNL